MPAFRAEATADPAALIEFGNDVRTYDPATLETEYVRLVSARAANPSAENSIRLALLLSYPGAPYYDTVQARQFLRDASNEPEASRDQSTLARLLDSLLDERNGLAGDAAVVAELFAQERAHSQQLGADLAEAREALAAERALRAMLQGQLDALKALEERLNADDRP